MYDGIYFVMDGLNYTPEKIKDLIHTEIAIVLDNSGSMYDVDEYRERGIAEYQIPEPEEIGNDISFKRVSLMTDMIDALVREEKKGNGQFRYSVSSFTADYYLLNGMDNPDYSKNAVERIKTEEQDFTGTKFEKAINFSLRSFTENLLGNRVVICLTDGESISGNSRDRDQEWAEEKLGAYLKEQGIDLILIGLGDAVNKGKLQKLANDSGGLLLYANDADALETLLDRIIKKVKVSSTEEIQYLQNNKIVTESNATIVADSGFDAAIDGFPIKNFSVIGSKIGCCFGFSITSKMIYEGYNESNQFWKLGKTKIHGLFAKVADIVGEDIIIPSAKLTKTTLDKLKKGQVYNLNLKINELLTPTPSLDRIIIENNYLYSDNAKEFLLNNGFEIVMITLEKETVVEGVAIKNFETYYYNPISEIANTIDPDGNSIIRLILRGQLSQRESIVKNNKIEFKEFINANDYLAPVIESLKSGRPSMVSINSLYGGHSVLATKISIDQKKLGTYYLYLYDSNEPGKNTIAVLNLARTIKNGYTKDKYDFNYYGGGMHFNQFAYLKIACVYEGVTAKDDYSPTGKTNNKKNKIFYQYIQE